MRFLKLSLVLCFIFVLLNVSATNALAADWGDWFKHWNLSGGYPVYGQSDIQSSGFGTTVTLVDDFGDGYSFQVTQNAYSGPAFQFPYSLRIPLYNNDHMSVGLTSTIRLFMDGPFGGGSLMGSHAGLYVSYAVTDSLSLIGSAGISQYMVSAQTDEVHAAWPGDPGLYHNGEFNEPGTSFSVSGTTDYAASFSVGAKYNILPWLFVEGSCSWWPDGTITEYTYTVGNIEVVDASMPAPISVSGGVQVWVGLGVGF